MGNPELAAVPGSRAKGRRAYCSADLAERQGELGAGFWGITGNFVSGYAGQKTRPPPSCLYLALPGYNVR